MCQKKVRTTFRILDNCKKSFEKAMNWLWHRPVASDIRGPRFDPSGRILLDRLSNVNCVSKRQK